MKPSPQGAKVLTFETKYHREVRKHHLFDLEHGAPQWAQDRAAESFVWMLQLECGHVVGPIVGETPPTRMHCTECAGGRGHGYRKRGGL